MMSVWGGWVRDCVRLLDGDGTYAHFPRGGSLMDQPYKDMSVFDVIRHRWNELRNAELERRMQWRETRK